MNKFKKKDKRNRSVVKNFEKKRFILKSIIKNLNYSNFIRWNAVLKLSNFLVTANKNHLLNYCIITGKKKRVTKLYNFSRTVFLKLIRSGLINGMKKSSW